MQVRDQIAWSLPSLIPRLLAHPSTPFSVGSRERPLSPNFPQLYIVEPLSEFNKGLRSALYYKIKNGNILIFLLYVDDLLLIVNFDEEIQ
jgi:hypothetical protein